MYIMPVEMQYRVAVEMGYPKATLKCTLRKCALESAGDLVDYMDANLEVLEVEEENNKEEEKEEKREKVEIPAVQVFRDHA